jgi:tetratricopeptide (TPR) repeat protein
MDNYFEEESLSKRSLKKKIRSYSDLLQHDPTNLLIRESRLRSMFFGGKLDAAFADCPRLIADSPSNFTAYWIMGNILSRRNQYIESENFLRKALELNHFFYPAFVDLGANLILQQRISEGVNEIHNAISIQPDYWLAHYNLGIAYWLQSKFKESYQEAQLVWNLHKSIRTFLNFLSAYDIAHKSWSMKAAYGLSIISILIPNIITLPLFVLALIRICINALACIQGKRKRTEGYLQFGYVVLIILTFVTRFH